MKKLSLILIASLIILCFNSCGKKEVKEEKSSVDNKAEASSQSNNPNVEMKENKIYNTIESEDGSVTVQEYVYSDEDTLSKINVSIKLPDDKAAADMYASITNGELKEEYQSKYDNIRLNDNIISAEMKEESVESMSVLNKEQMYLILGSNITTYNLSE